MKIAAGYCEMSKITVIIEKTHQILKDFVGSTPCRNSSSSSVEATIIIPSKRKALNTGCEFILTDGISYLFNGREKVFLRNVKQPFKRPQVKLSALLLSLSAVPVNDND